MNRKQFLKKFNTLSQRQKNVLIEKLAQPWIKEGAISEVPKDIRVILNLQDKSKKAEQNVANAVGHLIHEANKDVN